MNILLLASHAVAEYDDIRMFTDLGHDVFCPGGYQDPRESGEGIRPAIPNAAYHPDLIEACEVQRRLYGDPGPDIDWAKARLHDDVIDWADVIIVHHFVDRWVARQWPRIRHKRVIWRTCGQSNPELERAMTPLRDDGLQIVRYSPAEARFFGEVGAFAGEDALIRFGKYPDDYGPWTGEDGRVWNIAQHDRIPHNRDEFLAWGFWEAATEGLPRAFGGPHSEKVGGVGELTYEQMLETLRHARAYLYTGTRPASYTLGLIEAMLSGVPVVSIGAKAWGESWGGTDLFEAATSSREMRSIVAEDACFDSPDAARQALRWLLEYPDKAATISRHQRARAIKLFGIQTVGAQWQEFLA